MADIHWARTVTESRSLYTPICLFKVMINPNVPKTCNEYAQIKAEFMVVLHAFMFQVVLILELE